MGEFSPTFPPQKQNKPADVDHPAGSVPESQLWMPYMKDGKEVGFRDPDGKYYPLAEGESFAVEKDRDNNRFDVVVTGADGSLKIFHSGPLDPNQPIKEPQPVSQTPEGQPQKLDIDQNRLNEFLRLSAVPNATFGKEVTFTEADAQQIETIAAVIDKAVQAGIQNNSEWKKFEEMVATALTDGKLPPTIRLDHRPGWLVRGGSDAEVKSEYANKRLSITVPDRIYELHYWQDIVHTLREAIGMSESMRKGTSPKRLAADLTSAAHFLKETGQL